MSLAIVLHLFFIRSSFWLRYFKSSSKVLQKFFKTAWHALVFQISLEEG